MMFMIALEVNKSFYQRMVSTMATTGTATGTGGVSGTSRQSSTIS